MSVRTRLLAVLVGTVLFLLAVPRASEAVRLSFLTVAAVGGSDLVVTKTGPDTAAANSNITFTVNVSNLGPDVAPIVTLRDVIPNSLTFVSVEETSAGPDFFSCGPPSTGSTSTTVTCTTTNFPAGASRDFTVIVNIPPGTAPGTYTNVASAVITSSPPPGDEDPPLEVNEENNSSSATFTIPGATSADLLATKSGPANATPNSDVPFTIVIANAGPDAASNVSFSDTLPGDMTFVSMMQDNGPAFDCTPLPAVGSAGTVTCRLATMNSGASASFTLTGHIPLGSSGQYDNMVTVSSTPPNATPDPNPENNTGQASVLAGSADISITKAGPATAFAGNPITWLLTLTNEAPSDTAINPSFVDQLPTGTTFVSLTHVAGTPPSSCNTPLPGQTGTVSCTVGTLPSGVNSQYTLIASISSNVPNGSVINNTVSGSSENADPNPNNNSSTFPTTVQTSANLNVTKVGSPDPVNAGANLTYTITVTNDGPSDAANLELSDLLPPNTTFVSFTAPPAWTRTDSVPVGGTGTVRATAPALGAVNNAVFSLVVKLNSDTPAGQLSNTAVFTTTTSDPNEGNNSQTATTTVNTSADLSVAKTDSPDPVNAGSNLTYTITVTNNGVSDAQSLQLSDTVPANTTFVSFTVPGGWTRTDGVTPGGTGTVTATASTLASGASSQFMLVVNVTAGTADNATITNSATVTTTTADPDSNNNTGMTTTTVTNQADLQLTKGDAPDPVLAGNNLTYTINFKNNGPLTANSVTVTDAVPANTTFVSAVVTTGSGWASVTPGFGGTGNIVFSKGSVANQETATFTIVVNVNSDTSHGTTISNTAVAASSTVDPDSNNSTATATTSVGSFADLTITKTHAGNFSAGQMGASYTIRVTNSSTGPTSGLVTVTDNVPVGLTPTGPNGFVDGWSCSINGQTLTCTRSDVLVGGASYPDIILTVNVANPAPLSVTNTATVSGGGEVNTSNNTASDPTAIDCSQDFSLNNNSPLMISRFRMNGPAGPQDEFVEIFNPGTTAHTVASGNCAGGGYGVYASAGNGNTSNTAALVCYIPNGAVIPAGGYYLCTGATYSLRNLGRNGGAAGATAVGDAPITANIPDDAGLALMNVAQGITAFPGGFNGGIPDAGLIIYDKVGFAPYGPGAPASTRPSLADNFCEGSACLQPVGDASVLGTCTDPSGSGLFPVVAAAPACYGQSGQYELLRRQTAFDANLGTLHQDTNNGAADFIFISPNPGTNTGLNITGISGVTAVLGAAGPYNTSAPPDAPSTKLTRTPFDGTNQFGPRNAERNYVQDLSVADPANNPLGTFTLRYRYTNNSGVPINGLRFEVDNLSTLCGAQTATPGVGTGDARNLSGTPDCGTGSFTAILKVLNSATEVMVDSGGTAQTVNGTVMEDLSASATPTPPGAGPLSPNGGGIDNTLIVNPSGASASVGDGVTGGVGNFATTFGTSDPTKVLRVKVKFGVVRSGRFILLIVPMAKASPTP